MSNILKIRVLINNRVINSKKRGELICNTVQIFLQGSDKLVIFWL